MRKAVLLTLFTLAVALPTLAQEDDRHQSYLSFEEGGTVVRSGENGEEIQAHRNLPVYPGDEVVTARRGRAEVRLADGNIIGIDRATSAQFRSIFASYEGDGTETVVELKYGRVAIHRSEVGRDHVRLDTRSASYVADLQAVYFVETDPAGRDRVTVFDGNVEVRTPSRSTRLRAGDAANVDDRGAYDLIGDQRGSADDFQRWFLDRVEGFGSYKSRYMDQKLSYWTDDLDDHGRWVFVTGVGWSWSPYVAVGWRPYYNGYWHNRYGSMTWVSYDPWGWGPYHYGRWAYDGGYGWVWVPGYGYSPAWVYWSWGSGFVGWAPAGYWDCYRPYYGWAYHPYRGYGAHGGHGFYGRVRLAETDMRPWTFIDSKHVMSNRVDRAALTADAVKQRLARNGEVTVTSGAARLTREEWNDPADAIRRRSVSDRDGRNTGADTGAPATDLTPFFRRDGDVAGPVRDRVARGGGREGSVPRTAGGSRTAATTRDTLGRGGSSGSAAPITGGSLAPIGRGSVAPIGGGSVAPIGSSRRDGETPAQPSPSATNRGGVNRGSDRGGSTGGGTAVDRGDEPSPGTGTTRNSDSWRGRSSRTSRSGSGSSSSGGSNTSETADTPPSTGGGSSSGSSSDVPRRVIDRIGGARVYPRDTTRSSGGSSSSGRSSSVRESNGSSGSSGSSGDSSSTRSGSSSSRSSGGSSTRSSSSGSSSGKSSSATSGSSSRERGSSSSGSVNRGGSDSGKSSSSGSSSRSSSSGSSGRSSGGSGGRSSRGGAESPDND